MTRRTPAERAAWWRAYLTEELEQAWGHGAYPRALPGMLAPVLLDVAEVVDPRALAAAIKGPAHRDWSRVNHDGALEHLVNEAHEQILNASPAQVLRYAEDWYSGIPNAAVGVGGASPPPAYWPDSKFQPNDVVRLVGRANTALPPRLMYAFGPDPRGLVGVVSTPPIEGGNEAYEIIVSDPHGWDWSLSVDEHALELDPHGDTSNAARVHRPTESASAPLPPSLVLHDGQNVRILFDDLKDAQGGDLTGAIGIVHGVARPGAFGRSEYYIHVFDTEGGEIIRRLTDLALEPAPSDEEPTNVTARERLLANEAAAEKHRTFTRPRSRATLAPAAPELEDDQDEAELEQAEDDAAAAAHEREVLRVMNATDERRGGMYARDEARESKRLADVRAVYETFDAEARLRQGVRQSRDARALELRAQRAARRAPPPSTPPPRSAADARRQRDAAVDKALGTKRPAKGKAKRAAPPPPPVSVLDVLPADALRQYAQSSFALVHPESPAPRPRPAPRHEVAPGQLSIFDMTIDD